MSSDTPDPSASASSLDQDALDELIESISSSNFKLFNILLLHLNPEWIDRPHSTTQLSPLESLFTRYPQVNSTDLEILKALFEKGADLSKVNEKELSRMMEVEEENGTEEAESNSVKEEFEAVLIARFAELETLKEQVKGEDAEPEAIKLEETEETPPSPQQRSPSSPALSQERKPDLEAVVEQPPERSDHVNPDTFEAQKADSPVVTHSARSISPVPSTPRSLPSAPSAPPSRTPNPLVSPEDIRLYIALPPRTTRQYLDSYFKNTLRIPVRNVIMNNRGGCYVHLDVDREFYISGDFERKIVDLERNGKPFTDPTGRRWRLKPQLTGDKTESSSRYGREEETSSSRDNGRTRDDGYRYDPSRSLQARSDNDRVRGGREGDWIGLEIRGFSTNSNTREIEKTLSSFLDGWRNLQIKSENFKVLVMLDVDGEEQVETAIREGSKAESDGVNLKITREVPTRAEAEGGRWKARSSETPSTTRRHPRQEEERKETRSRQQSRIPHEDRREPRPRQQSSLSQNGGEQEWISLKIRGLPANFTRTQFEETFGPFLDDWKDLESWPQGLGSAMRVTVQGEERAAVAMREGSNVVIAGKKLMVSRDLSTILRTKQPQVEQPEVTAPKIITPPPDEESATDAVSRLRKRRDREADDEDREEKGHRHSKERKHRHRSHSPSRSKATSARRRHRSRSASPHRKDKHRKSDHRSKGQPSKHSRRSRSRSRSPDTRRRDESPRRSRHSRSHRSPSPKREED